MFLMRRRVFLCLFVLLLDPSRNISAVKLDMKYCGFEQKCTGNKTNIDQLNQSCCKPCECADICKERDSCCTNKERLDDNEEYIKQKCLPSVYKPDGRYASGSEQSYFTRTRCPISFKNLSIKEKCENEIFESLEDITLVSSEDGTIVYKNKFCGLCHGEKRTVPWEIGISSDCAELLMEQDVTSVTVTPTLFAHCSISMKEPDNLAFMLTACLDSALIIDQCNRTGRWEVYDSKLEELCVRSPEAVSYYKMTPKRYVVYRSVYCYLCNTEASAAPDTCQLESLKKYSQDPFISLIKPNEWKDQGRRSNICKTDQILDTFFNVCRRLYCPKFFLSRNGGCVPFLDSTTIHYPLTVRLVPRNPISKTESIKKELMSRYVGVQRQLGLGSCELCSAYVYLTNAMNKTLLSDVYMNFALTVTKKCKLEYLVSKLNSIEMTPSSINIRLLEKMVRFDAFWENTNLRRPDLFERIHSSPGTCRVPSTVRASNCAKVKLTREEYQSVLKSHVSASELLFAPVQEDMNGTVFVCCDKYIVNLRSAGVRKQLNVAMVFFTIMIAIDRSGLLVIGRRGF